MSNITDELNRFTSSMNVQGKYADPHAKTNFQTEIDKLDLSFQRGEIPQDDYVVKKANLLRMLNRPKNII